MTSSAAVFEVGGTVYTWADVANFARFRGDWDAVADAHRIPAPSQAAADAAARAFRHERRLLSADDLEAWLERRGVTVDRWLAYFRGTLGTDDEDTWAEAMCSGLLDRRAEELARRRAVAPDVALDQLDAAYEDFAREAATDEVIDREIAAARLDWIRIRCALAVYENESVAAEVALRVREDGEPFVDAVREGGAAAAEQEIWLEDADSKLAPLLAGARRGDLIGPIATADGFVLVEIHGKLPADREDPAVRDRAIHATVERAADRRETDRVVWHEQL